MYTLHRHVFLMFELYIGKCMQNMQTPCNFMIMTQKYLGKGNTQIIVCTNEHQQSAYVKTKVQISFIVTAKLISAFVLATWIVQFLYFLNKKIPASSHLLCACTARFVSNLFGNHIVGFLKMWLRAYCT